METGPALIFDELTQGVKRRTERSLWGLKEWIATFELEYFEETLYHMTYPDIINLPRSAFPYRTSHIVCRLMEAIHDQKLKEETIDNVLKSQLNSKLDVFEAIYKLSFILEPVDIMLSTLSVKFTKAAELLFQELQKVDPDGSNKNCAAEFYYMCLRIENNPTFHEGEKQKFAAWKLKLNHPSFL